MKRVLLLASFVLTATVCLGQGFDKEMEAAGKKFHKDSQKVGKSSSKKQKRVNTSGAGKSKAKDSKGVSTLDGTKKKKNKARRKGHRQRG